MFLISVKCHTAMSSKSLTELLEKLSNVYGASGFEDDVRTLLRREIKEHVDKTIVDSKGNLICHHKGDGKEPISMVLAAHMDEIGLMAREIDKNGFIYFSNVGVLSKQVLLGQKVHIQGRKKEITGVITHKKLHIGEEADTFPDDADLYVDCGGSGGGFSPLD